MVVIKTPSAEHLNIDGIVLKNHPKNGRKVFPDKEVYVQLPEIQDIENAKIIHSASPRPNQSMMFLYGILEILKESEIELEIFFTYFPYSMQDNSFFDGTLNRAKSIIEKLVEYYEVNKIYAINPHFSEREWVNDFPVKDIDASKKLLGDLGKQHYTILGPDDGSGERLDVKSLSKERIGSRDVDISYKDGNKDLQGDIVVLDDIVETGGTMCGTYDKLSENTDVDEIIGAAIHGVLEEGQKKLKNTFDNYLLTNTVESRFSNVRVEPIIRKNLDLK